MDTYKELIHRLLLLCEEAAKLTGNTWDDSIANAVHTIFDQWFHIMHSGKIVGANKTAMEGRFTLTAEQALTLPAWLQVFLLTLAKLLPLLL